MIILDTHIWIWWVNGDDVLGTGRKELINAAETVAVSAISCFEVSWLERHNRIELPYTRTVWFEKALQGSDSAHAHYAGNCKYGCGSSRAPQ